MSRKRPKTRPQARTEVDRPRSAPRLWLAAALVAAGAIAYSTSFSGVLVLDDVRAIAQNPTIRTLWPPSVPLAPPGESTVAGRPIANLSFALNYALAPAGARDVFAPDGPGAAPGTAERFLENAWGYHAFNLAIHVTAALLLFGIVRRTLVAGRFAGRFDAAAPWLAFAAALVWVVHPLNTTAVTYLVQRVESLMGVFYLLTLYAAIRASGGGRRAWTVVAIAACALGMATKEVMVTAPVVVVLWLHTFGDARDRSVRPLLAGLAASWLVFAALVWHEHRAASIDAGGATTWRYLLTQAEVVTHYLRLAVVPAPLVFLYSWPLAESVAQVWPQAVFLLALVALTALGLARRHPLGFVGAWVFGILAPTSTVVPIVTEVAAEHRMYLPLAGLIAAAAVLAFVAWQQLAARFVVQPSTRRRAGAALASVLVAGVAVACAAETRERNRDYASAERLWGDTVAKQPRNQRARVAFGEALTAGRRFADAEAQFAAAVELAPGDPVARVRLGSVQAAQGKLDEALPHFERALEIRPDDPDANRAVGLAYAVRHDDARAVTHLERAVAARPGDAFLLGQLATILVDSSDASVRDVPRALRVAEQAARTTARQDPAVLEILSVALATSGRLPEAATAAGEALALARAQGNAPLVARLERRVASFGPFLSDGAAR